MFSNRATTRQPLGFGGSGEPPPVDILVLLGVLLFTYSLGAFQGLRVIPELLKLTPMVWQGGFLWQLFTYAFVADYATTGGLWLIVSLLITFMFGRDVFRYLGRRQFWWMMAWAVGVAAVVAVGTELGVRLLGGGSPMPFVLLQGEGIVLTILIAAFATLYGHATIYLFFVLPIRARWFLGIEILFAFLAFLDTAAAGAPDLGGFLGICAAVALTYNMLSGRTLSRLLREWRLRLERKILEARLGRMRRKRKLRVVRPDEGGDVWRNPDDRDDPWVH